GRSHVSVQTAICHTRHSVSARSRCLLEIHDRVIGDAFPFTHQHMANLIAANRTTVNLAASSLRRAGLIATDRAYVRIVDRKRLQAASCDCYVPCAQPLRDCLRTAIVAHPMPFFSEEELGPARSVSQARSSGQF